MAASITACNEQHRHGNVGGLFDGWAAEPDECTTAHHLKRNVWGGGALRSALTHSPLHSVTHHLLALLGTCHIGRKDHRLDGHHLHKKRY